VWNSYFSYNLLISFAIRNDVSRSPSHDTLFFRYLGTRGMMRLYSPYSFVILAFPCSNLFSAKKFQRHRYSGVNVTPISEEMLIHRAYTEA
jgi:hypothetical protein